MAVEENGLVGVAAALASITPARTALSQFHLACHVALVTGGHRGIGLEMSLALAEAGAVVYCIDLPNQPNEQWLKVQSFAAQLPPLDEDNSPGRLEYMCCDVTDQDKVWKIAEKIAEKEGRLDICVANAGILASGDCLEYSAAEFQKLMDVNVNGVLFSVQAAGRQMERLKIKGSIIMIASIMGSVALQNYNIVAYNTSKSAVLQMARSMACELGSKGIRVNTISPGFTYTQMIRNFTDTEPHLIDEWSALNPLGRLGRPDELRGAVIWLASKASTFCTGSNIIVDGGHCAW